MKKFRDEMNDMLPKKRKHTNNRPGKGMMAGQKRPKYKVNYYESDLDFDDNSYYGVQQSAE